MDQGFVSFILVLLVFILVPVGSGPKLDINISFAKFRFVSVVSS